jgi:hypothetical protein
MLLTSTLPNKLLLLLQATVPIVGAAPTAVTGALL